MKHILSVLVVNHPGVLAKVAGLFSRRGFNIDSLAVGVTNDPNVSRMTILTEGDDSTVEQIARQLGKLVDVIKVTDVTENSVTRELALIKLRTTSETRGEIIEIINIFRAKVVDISTDFLTAEITGDSEKVSALEDMLKGFGIEEMVRTGIIAISRGKTV
jgi:acetolactate synthase-1/3 small subunit